ncbi:hypothetical protein [Maribellus mangrovi]|uniref:hypothetical protein n=1 Tax=Maribellus mangrovi TaxID=3133146 RepID=UPI0030EB74EF
MKSIHFLFIGLTALFLSCNNTTYTMPGLITIRTFEGSVGPEQDSILAIIYDKMNRDSIESEIVSNYSEFDSVSIFIGLDNGGGGIPDTEGRDRYILIKILVDFKASQTSQAYQITEYYKALIIEELKKYGYSQMQDKKSTYYVLDTKRNTLDHREVSPARQTE